MSSPSPELYSPVAQAARRADLLAAVARATLPRFNAAGEWVAPGAGPGIRERQWHCLALLAGGPEEIALANRLLETSGDDHGDFNSFTSTLILRLHEARLTEAARAATWQVAAANLPHSYEHVYRYTENCSVLNCFALLEETRRTGDPRPAARARERLALYVEQRRHGVSHEFFSNNYLPVFLTGLGAIATYSDDAAAAATARALEEDVWRELAAAWHPGLLFLAGPSARSYTVDSLGLSIALRTIVWVALGEAAHPSPADLGLFAEPCPLPLEADHVWFSQSGCAMWCACSEWHLPPEAAALLVEKPYPFHVDALSHVEPWREYQPVGPEVDVRSLGGWKASPERGMLPTRVCHPGGEAVLSVDLAADWGLGASSRHIYGQCDFCRATWRRAEPVTGLAELGALYTRYVVNEALEEVLGAAQYGGLLSEQGRGGCLASGPLAVAWYAARDTVAEGVTRLRTCAILSCGPSGPDEAWLGARQCEGFSGSAPAEEWVFVRDGQAYLALHPLALTDWGRRVAVELQTLGDFRAVSLYNYEGPARDFRECELRQTCGGFVLILGSRAEWGDFARFREACGELECSDEVYESQRDLRVRWGERSLEVLGDLQTESLLALKRDGRFVERRRLHWEGGPA